MLFDFSELAAADRYKLLTATIVPRPIAWVVSADAAGRVNAAPFSFFNAFGSDPPVVCIGIGGRAPRPPKDPGSPKDSAANIRATGQFVICLVPYGMVDPMHVTALDFPAGTDELAEAGLRTLPSTRVRPPRIEGSPVAFECERMVTLELGPDQGLVVGRVLAMHVRDDAVLDADRCHVDTLKLDLVGRMHGGGGYVRASGPGVFERARLRLTDWVRRT